MKEQAWVEMLRRIPAQFHDGMTLATVTGVDIIMQSVLRLDEKFLILRGRPAGTSDAGRVMVVPYEQINYISLAGKPTDQQAQAIFGGELAMFAVLPQNLPAASANGHAETPIEEHVADSSDPITESAEEAPKPVQTSKSMLLAKLRAKLTGEGPKSVSSK
jgi:hypothetical protein